MDCVHKMMDRAIEMEGTVSGEHAIGLGKKVRSPKKIKKSFVFETCCTDPSQDCLADELGPATIHLMKDLKRTLDPK